MKQDHRPWDPKTFVAGANTDADGEVPARTPGQYVDSQNLRIFDSNGNVKALTKIGGERLLNGPDSPGGDTYRCIGSIFCKGNRIEFWASFLPLLYPALMRVNGITMVRSFDLPYVINTRLQLHKSEECAGGLVFDARSGSIPLQWDIGDIIRAFNAGEQTYFVSFQVSQVQVNPTRPVNRPLFTGLARVGDGIGLKGGQYFWCLRGVNLAGDRTPNGPELGPVLVPYFRGVGWETPNRPHPLADTAGMSIPQVGVPTGFGAALSFRYNNIANFDSVELLRIQYNLNGGPEAAPVIEIAHRFPLVPGQNQVFDYIDVGNVVEEIPTDENATQVFFIKEANSVRYVSHRVWYGGVVLGAKDIRGTFNSPEGSRLIPFTKSLGVLGHGDPVNGCYFRRFQSNERYAIGVVYYDTTGGQSYVQSVEDNALMPSRRDMKTGASDALSDARCWAANVDNVVSPTFEVFDIDNAVGKTRTDEVVNIMEGGLRRIGGWITGEAQATTNAGGESQDGIFVEDGVPYGPWLKAAYIHPFRPVNPQDWKFGLDYRVNTAVHPGGRPDSTGSLIYNPKVFAPTHHTLGLGFTGLTSVPNGAQGFSLVGQSAGRVVAQGLLKWYLTNGGDSAAMMHKDKFTAHLCIPDFNAGVLNQEVWEGLLSAGGRYKIQLVSPLGIATEQYGSVMASLGDPNPNGAASVIADVLSPVRVLWDTGQVNPGSAAGGFSPSPPLPPVPASGGAPDHFVGYRSWRNAPDGQPGNGNALISIVAAGEVVHDSGERSMLVTSDTPFFNYDAAPNSSDINNPNVQAFHEPMYVVNIIQDGLVPDTSLGYRGLNHYQAFVSAIGTTTGIASEQFRLVDENLDLLVGVNQGDERYLYLRTPTAVLVYLNGAYFAGQVPAIVAEIVANGFFTTPLGVQVHGIFNITTNDLGQFFVVSGTDNTPVAAAGSVVEVRYDFGTVKCYGDRTSTPAMATMVDAFATANPPNGVPVTQVGTQAGGNQSIPAWPIYSEAWFDQGRALRTFGLPIPFANYEYNGRYFVPFGRGFGVINGNLHGRMEVNQFKHGTILSVRQWKLMFDCESIVPFHLSSFERDGNKTYGNINYVQRPYNFIAAGSMLGNGVFSNYDTSALFGPSEQNNWRLGGLKSIQQPLPDYVIRRQPLYFKHAEFGFQEETLQCNALIYSAKDSPLLQDSPGLKTFPVSNIEFIENDTGGIQRLYSIGPSNLYVITEGGVYNVLVDRTVAYSADGTEFGQFAQDKAVGIVNNVSKTAGMPGRTWQLAAEGAPFLAPGTRIDALMWYDGTTAYMLAGNAVKDIAIGRYRKALEGSFEAQRGAFPFSAAFDMEKSELYLNFLNEVRVFAGSDETMFWQGKYSYVFDDYLYADGKMYGMRNLSTFVLNDGDDISGAPVEGWVKVASAPNPGERMEWMRVKIDSPRKPKRIEWYDEFDVLVGWMDEATFGPFYLKKETNWEQYVPLDRVTLAPKKQRLQGRLAYYKVIFNDLGDDKVVMSATQVKSLK